MPAAAAHGGMAAPQVLVVGGGLIGAATAFYLSKKGAKPIVLEAVSPACSASGKAGECCCFHGVCFEQRLIVLCNVQHRTSLLKSHMFKPTAPPPQAAFWR